MIISPEEMAQAMAIILYLLRGLGARTRFALQITDAMLELVEALHIIFHPQGMNHAGMRDREVYHFLLLRPGYLIFTILFPG